MNCSACGKTWVRRRKEKLTLITLTITINLIHTLNLIFILIPILIPNLTVVVFDLSFTCR